VTSGINAQVPTIVNALIATNVPSLVTSGASTAISEQVPPLVTSGTNSIIASHVPSMVSNGISNQVPSLVSSGISSQVPPIVASAINSQVPPMVSAALVPYLQSQLCTATFTNNTTYSLASGVTATIPWDKITNGIANLQVGSGVFSNVSGQNMLLTIACTLAFASGGGTLRTGVLVQTGGGASDGTLAWSQLPPVSGNPTMLSLSATLNVPSGATLAIQAYQDSGSALYILQYSRLTISLQAIGSVIVTSNVSALDASVSQLQTQLSGLNTSVATNALTVTGETHCDGKLWNGGGWGNNYGIWGAGDAGVQYPLMRLEYTDLYSTTVINGPNHDWTNPADRCALWLANRDRRARLYAQNFELFANTTLNGSLSFGMGGRAFKEIWITTVTPTRMAAYQASFHDVMSGLYNVGELFYNQIIAQNPVPVTSVSGLTEYDWTYISPGMRVYGMARKVITQIPDTATVLGVQGWVEVSDQWDVITGATTYTVQGASPADYPSRANFHSNFFYVTSTKENGHVAVNVCIAGDSSSDHVKSGNPCRIRITYTE
jgi:hypothetical protein